MPNIKLEKLTTPQLKYLESLVEKLQEPTFKVNRMSQLVGRTVSFLTDLTKAEASKLITILEEETKELDN